jgi:hypothetical protein
MKKNTKMIIGIVLITGLFVIVGLSITHTFTNAEEPPDKDPGDPGNAPGPGLDFGINMENIGFIDTSNPYSLSSL